MSGNRETAQSRECGRLGKLTGIEQVTRALMVAALCNMDPSPLCPDV